jgi:hypothetical protein
MTTRPNNFGQSIAKVVATVGIAVLLLDAAMSGGLRASPLTTLILVVIALALVGTTTRNVGGTHMILIVGGLGLSYLNYGLSGAISALIITASLLWFLGLFGGRSSRRLFR